MSGGAVGLLKHLWRDPVRRRIIVYGGVIGILAAIPVRSGHIEPRRRSKEYAARASVRSEALSYIKTRSEDASIAASDIVEHLQSAEIPNPFCREKKPLIGMHGGIMVALFADDPRQHESRTFVMKWRMTDSMKPSEWYLAIGNDRVRMQNP